MQTLSIKGIDITWVLAVHLMLLNDSGGTPSPYAAGMVKQVPSYFRVGQIEVSQPHFRGVTQHAELSLPYDEIIIKDINQ
jgi:hypothetical protein